jgi:hypothetical protein
MSKIRLKGVSKEVLQYTLKGDLVTRYPTKEDACTALGLKPTALNTVLSRHAYSAAGYMWIYYGDLHLLSAGNFVASYLNSRKNPNIKPTTTRRGQPIIKVEPDTGYALERFETMKQAGLAMGQTNASAISRCCCGNIPTAYGFKWMTEIEYKEKYPEY